jgi:tRNA(fMet)-specific endonuclease VapC
MTSFLFDTNHASEYLKDINRVKKPAQQHPSDTFGLCSPVVAELWFMVYNSRRIDENRRKLDALVLQFATWSLDPPATEMFGRLKADLRRAGRIVADVDLQIASIALSNDLTLLSADTALANVPGLKHENWLA